jgi:hypothetical protein
MLAAEDIFGPNMGSLKGKTVPRKNMHVPSLVADVPHDIVKMHRDVAPCFDIMFVNKIAFLVTVSPNLRFGTTEHLPSRNAGVVGKALVTVLKFCRQPGFRVKECHGDGEFESLRATLADAGSGLNVTSEDEHFPDVERCIRTAKERAWSSHDTVPFKKLPGMMIVKLIHGRVCWLNSFPAKDGVSAVQSPRHIMTGQQADCGLHCQLDFGEHAQVHDSHDNSMASRTTGAIALRPTGNVQGGCYFMSLSTGRRLNWCAWTPLPMPGEVINRVHALAARNPAGSELLFGWRNGTEIPDTPTDEDDLHDEDYDPADDDSDDDSSQAPRPPPVAGMDNDVTSDDEDDEDQGNAITSGDENQDEDQDDADDIDDIDDDHDDDGDDDDGMPPLLPRTNDDDNDTDSSHEDYDPSDDDSDDDEPDPGDSAGGDDASSPTGVAVGRAPPAGVPATRVSFPGVPPTGVATTMDNACGPRQREGMRRRKPARSAEEIKEPQTAAHRGPRMAPSLRAPTKQQQQADSLAAEHMQVHMSGLYDLQHTALKRGLTLCVQPQKALCGTLSASLLFWKDLSQHLKEQGFAPNPYDSCVMNKMAKGKQSTILWHVDDPKTSHVDGRVNEDIIEKLNDRHGKETPVTVTRGDIHDCLGMTIDCGANGKVKIRRTTAQRIHLGTSQTTWPVLPPRRQRRTSSRWTTLQRTHAAKKRTFFTVSRPGCSSCASEPDRTFRHPSPSYVPES